MYDPAEESNPRSITLDASILTITITKTVTKISKHTTKKTMPKGDKP